MTARTRTGGLPAGLRELLGYGFATLVAFGIDVGLLTLLVARLRVHYLLAAAVSFVIAAAVMWLLCVRFVFRFRRVASAALELSAFVALGVVGLVVQAAVMFLGVEVVGAHYLAAKLSASCCTFFINFLLRRTLLFSAASVDRGRGSA